jgi:hypothetical protein
MSQSRKPIVYVIFMVLFVGVGSAHAQWMSLIPRSEFGGFPQTFLDACLNMNQWPTPGGVTNSLGSFAGDLGTGANQDPGSMAACFTNMRNAGLELSIEAAALQPPGTPGGCGLGQDCFNWLAPILDQLIALGAPQINIRMQEPLTDARNVGYPDNDAVNQTVIFMQNLRNNYPGIKITSVEAYPYINGTWIRWWMGAINEACANAGIAHPDAIELDHDIVLSGTSNDVFNDIQSTQNIAHLYGWQFNVIFCAMVADPSDYNFFTQLLFRGQAYMQHGVIPDNYIIESWEHTSPTFTVPETSPYTFMYDAAQFRLQGFFPR